MYPWAIMQTMKVFKVANFHDSVQMLGLKL